MAEHKLKTQPWSYGTVVREGYELQARLGNKEFNVGDKVTFEEVSPLTGEPTGAKATVTLTHADKIKPLDWYTEEAIKEHGMAHLGLSRSDDPVLVPSADALINLKAAGETYSPIASGKARVDTRLADKKFKHGGAVIYHEIDADGKYTGAVAVRNTKRVTPFNPFEFYTPEQVRTHGLVVLGWSGLEDIIKAKQ